MIERRKTSRKTLLCAIHHNSIAEHVRKMKLEEIILVQKDRQSTSICEEPAKQNLLNEDLQSLASKLEILKSFSVSTPDTILAEHIVEAVLNEQKNIDKDLENIDHDTMHIVNLRPRECIEL